MRRIFITVFCTCLLLQGVLAGDPVTDSLSNALLYAGGKEKIKLLHLLTRNLWGSDPGRASYYSIMAVKLSEASHDTSLMALSYKNSGIVSYFSGRYPDAIRDYRKALGFYQAVNDQSGISGCLNNLGIIYKDLGDYAQALNYYEQSAAIDLTIRDVDGLASTWTNIGEVYHLRGMYVKALEYYKKSLVIELSAGNTEGAAENYLNMGAACQENGNFSEALRYYDMALDIFTKAGNLNRVALTLHNIAYLYFSVNDLPRSFENANKALEIRRKLHDLQGIASTGNLMATLYEAAGETELAGEYFFDAIRLELKLGNRKKASMVLLDHGISLMKRKEYENAINFLLNSLEIAQSIAARPEIRDSYKNLSECYFRLKDMDKAYQYSDLYLMLADSMDRETAGFLAIDRMSDSMDNAGIVSQGLFSQSKADGRGKSKNSTVIAPVVAGMAALLLIVVLLLWRQRAANNRMMKELEELRNSNKK